MRKIMTVLILVWAVSPVFAETVHDYKYLSISYMHTEIDSQPDDEWELNVEGVVRFASQFHLFVYAGLQELGGEGGDIDSEFVIIGLGVNAVLWEKGSVYGRIGYGWTEAEGIQGTIDGEALGPSDDEGYVTETGIRVQLASQLEAAAGISLSRIEDGTNTTFRAGMTYNLRNHLQNRLKNRAVGIGAGIRVTEDEISLLAGLRFYFP